MTESHTGLSAYYLHYSFALTFLFKIFCGDLLVLRLRSMPFMTFPLTVMNDTMADVLPRTGFPPVSAAQNSMTLQQEALLLLFRVFEAG